MRLFGRSQKGYSRKLGFLLIEALASFSPWVGIQAILTYFLLSFNPTHSCLLENVRSV
jgi:hypothetical protein